MPSLKQVFESQKSQQMPLNKGSNQRSALKFTHSSWRRATNLFLYNVGIAVGSQTTNDYFYSNTFTVSPAQYTNAYYGIAVNQMFLNPSFTNIINNTFLPNGGLGDGVFA
jgi:hypothetical protein